MRGFDRDLIRGAEIPQLIATERRNVIAMHPEMKHGSVEDRPRDDTGRIQSRQNGGTGTDRVTKDTIRGREKVSSGANFIFTFSDTMG
jgi:hypothetical protein